MLLDSRFVLRASTVISHHGQVMVKGLLGTPKRGFTFNPYHLQPTKLNLTTADNYRNSFKG